MGRKIRLVFLIAAIYFSAGCRQTTEKPPVAEPSSLPTATSEVIDSPTVTPSPQPTAIPLKVVFDGEECSGSLPDKLSLGEHTFELLDLSDFPVELWLVRLTNDKTLQDLLDLQSSPGEWDPKPRWAAYDTDLSREYMDLDDGRIETTRWKFYLEGEHVVYCYIPSPQMIYYAGSIQVMESQTE